MFQRWAIEITSVASNWDRGVAASAALRDYFADVLAERRRQPADDLISDLVVAEVDGRTLDDEEIYSFLRLLLPAGVETTYRASGNLLYGLLTNPDQLQTVQGRPLPAAGRLRGDHPLGAAGDGDPPAGHPGHRAGRGAGGGGCRRRPAARVGQP